MEAASQIMVSADLGLSQLSVLTTNKNARLLEALALTTEISTYIAY